MLKKHPRRRLLDEEELISSSDDEELLAEKSKETLMNKIGVLERELKRAKPKIKKEDIKSAAARRYITNI